MGLDGDQTMGETIKLLKDRKQFLSERRDVLLQYLYNTAKEEDWHGTSDAANDLREVDAEFRVISKTLDRLILIHPEK